MNNIHLHSAQNKTGKHSLENYKFKQDYFCMKI